MRRLDIPGAWYGEALVSGAYAVLVPGYRIETHLSAVPLPDGDNTLYLRCTDVGGFKMAGQSHGGRGTWEWSDGIWRIVGPSFGVNPQIYDAVGHLHIATNSHQGYRFVDRAGRIWTGDETYADPVLRLGEYTTHEDLSVGQSGFSCQALYQGKRYVLATGSCKNIVFNRQGDACAVTIHIEGVGTSLLWFDVSELAAEFPEEHVLPPPPPPPPPRPECTIVTHPESVYFGDGATCIASYSGGPATRAIWEYKRVEALDWKIAVVQEPPLLTHTYRFDLLGWYVIRLSVEGPGGSDTTQTMRLVEVEERPYEPPDEIPAPDALPDRSPFLLGAVWPTPDATFTPDHLPGHRLALLRLLGLKALRFDLHMENPRASDLIVHIASHGLRPFPEITFTPPPSRADSETYVAERVTQLRSFAERMAQTHPWILDWEVYNEYAGLGMMTGRAYAAMVCAVASGVRAGNPEARIWISADGLMTHVDRSAPSVDWQQVQAGVPADLYDGIAIHPYRTPKPWHETAWGTREEEFAEAKRRAGGKSIVVTEVGWTDTDVGAEQAAINLTNEIHSARLAGVSAVFIYAYATPLGEKDDWGLFVANGEDWQPSRKAEAVAHYIVEHKL